MTGIVLLPRRCREACWWLRGGRGCSLEFVLGGALHCERVVSHKVFGFAWSFVSQRDPRSRDADGDASRSGLRISFDLLMREFARKLRWNAGLKPSAYIRTANLRRGGPYAPNWWWKRLRAAGRSTWRKSGRGSIGARSPLMPRWRRL